MPIRISAAAYKGSGANARVMLTIDIAGRALERDRWREFEASQLQIDGAVIDAAGDIRRLRFHVGSPALAGEAYARGSRHGVRVLASVELPPGPSEVTVTARTAAGSADAQLRFAVPDFSGPLTLSGTSIASDVQQPLVISSHHAAPLVLPSQPTARREFRARETLSLYTEVYESEQRLQQGPRRGRAGGPDRTPIGDHTTNLVAQLIDEEGVILMTRVGTRVADSEQTIGRHAFTTTVPLNGVPPGQYVLRIRARANIGTADSASDTIPIVVR